MLEWLTEIIDYLSQLDIAQFEQLLNKYSSFGPLPGIVLPLIEAFLPFLPLIVIVTANASAYGLWLGFTYSSLGSVLGATLVFLIARLFGKRLNFYLTNKYPRAERFFTWIEERGFTPLFLLYCFPFTPSFFVNLAAGVSRVPLQVFFPAILFGKSVMIFMLSFVGHDWKGFIFHPWRLALVALVLFLLWYIGKRVEKYYQID